VLAKKVQEIEMPGNPSLSIISTTQVGTDFLNKQIA